MSEQFSCGKTFVDAGTSPEIITISETKSFIIKAKKPVKEGCKQVYDKTNYCTFCSKAVHGKIHKHLLTHRGEVEIKDICLMPVKSKQRSAAFKKLANDGNFKHNSLVFQTGSGEIVVARRRGVKAGISGAEPIDHLPCDFCHKFLKKSSLWRHKRSCSETHKPKERQNPDNDEQNPDDTPAFPATTQCSAVREGRTLLNSAVFIGEETCLTDLMNRMRDNSVKEVAIGDKLIRHYAVVRMQALGHKSDQKPGDIHRVSQAVRTLARMLQLAREIKGDCMSLDCLLTAANFDMVVLVARKMSIDKNIPALNVGKTVGLLVKRVALVKRGCALREGDRQRAKDAREFRTLYFSDWNYRVNSAAVKRINTLKRCTVQTIPLTDDLMQLRTFMLSKMKDLDKKLKVSPCSTDWVEMAKLTMSRLILFNKRRRAEVKDLKVNEYISRPDWHTDERDEMAMALSPTDRLLVKR